MACHDTHLDYVAVAQDDGKVVSLTYRSFLLPGNTPGTHFCYRLGRLQDHSAIGRIMSMKNSNDTIWSRTSGLPICSTVPKPLCYRGPRFLSVCSYIFWSAEFIYRSTGRWLRIIRVEGSDHGPNKDSVRECAWMDTESHDNFSGPKIQHTVICKKVLMSVLGWLHRVSRTHDTTYFRHHNWKEKPRNFEF
jgi:hypothetical protein